MSILHHHLTLDQLRDNEPDSPLDTLADRISILTTILLVAPKHGAVASRHREQPHCVPEALEGHGAIGSGAPKRSPERSRREGSSSASSQTPAPKPPSPLLTGSGARALCKLASLADQWCHLILEGCRPNQPAPLSLSKHVPSAAEVGAGEAKGTTQTDPSAPTHYPIALPPTDTNLLAPWLHAMHRAIRARIHEHFLEATRLAETQHRPINDADNRLVSLLLRIDPPNHALAKLHSPEAKRQAQRHAIEQARALERNTARPNAQTHSSPVIPPRPEALEGTGAAALGREAYLERSRGVEGHPERSAQPWGHEVEGPGESSPTKKASSSSPRDKPPQHPNPSKQYKLRKPKPAPISAAA